MLEFLLKISIKGILFLSIYLSMPITILANDNKCSDNKDKPRVILIIPAPQDSVFWQEVAQISQVASSKLNIDLKIYHFEIIEGLRYEYPQFIDQILTNEPNSDYLISYFINSIEQKTLDIVKKHNIQFFSFNSPFTEKLANTVGRPRDKGKEFWLGHVATNEIKTGYDLANFLINKKQKEQKELTLLAISGNRNSDVALMRELGLINRVKQDTSTSLLQIMPTNWTYQETRRKTKMLLKRFTNIDVIWCASDTIARAVFDEVKDSQPELLKHLVIGGIDWSESIISYLEKSQLDVSFGGHIFDIAYLLALIYDYHNGLDFKPTRGVVIENSNKPLIGGDSNITSVRQFSSLDFKSLSQCINNGTAIKPYSAEVLLQTHNPKTH